MNIARRTLTFAAQPRTAFRLLRNGADWPVREPMARHGRMGRTGQSAYEALVVQVGGTSTEVEVVLGAAIELSIQYNLYL
jgi:hypothetical protein